MNERIKLTVVAILALALVAVSPVAAKDREKGPKELAAEKKVYADDAAPTLLKLQKLGKQDARDAGVTEEISSQLPFATENLPPVPSQLDSAPSSLRKTQAVRRIATPISGCWRATWNRGAGTWPYTRDIYQETTWCTTIYNNVASFSGRSWPHTGYGCAPNYGPTYQRVGGGVGSSSVDIETRGGFSCNIYWYGLQVWLWMVPRYYGWGGTAMAGWGQ